MPTSKAGSSPFSPPSTAPPSGEELGWGSAGVGLGKPGRGLRSSRSSSGNCTSNGGSRPGPVPAGREPQEGERTEEGEEEGKEEEERSSQQARGGRTSWCGGCQQPRKRLRENREELSSGESDTTREETWETHSPRPPRRLHLEDRGLNRPLPHQPRDTWGFRGRAWALPRRRGFPLSPSANFPRRCLAE